MTQRHRAGDESQSAPAYPHLLATLASASPTFAWLRAKLAAAFERLLRSSVRPPATTVLEIESKLHQGPHARRNPGDALSGGTMPLGEMPVMPLVVFLRRDEGLTPRELLRSHQGDAGQLPDSTEGRTVQTALEPGGAEPQPGARRWPHPSR